MSHGVRSAGACPPPGGPSCHLTLHIGTDEGVEPPFPSSWFEQVTSSALTAAGVGGEVELALLLAGDETLHRLNRDYRSVDRPTDVLSFAQEEEGSAPFQPPPGEARHLGDVAISLERVRRQAVEHGHSFERELGYLLTHGVLHLVGYDHARDDDQAAMRDAEERALAAVGLPREDQPRDVDQSHAYPLGPLHVER